MAPSPYSTIRHLAHVTSATLRFVVVAQLLALLIVGALPAWAAPPAQQGLATGTVVKLSGTDHIWVAEGGTLHWAGDTRALAGQAINWSSTVEVTAEQLRALPIGDPWLSAGLLKDGDPIYLVKWEANEPSPRLLHIQSIRDVQLFGINSTNYGAMVLDKAEWERRYPFKVDSLARAPLTPAVDTLAPAISPGVPAPSELSGTPYRNSRYDITLRVPNGWTVDDTDPRFVVALRGERGTNVLVGHLRDTGGLPLEVLLLRDQLQASQLFTDFTAMSSGTITMAGHPARYREHTGKLGSLSLTQRGTAVRRGSDVYVLVSTADADEWPRLLTQFLLIEQSFQFADPAPSGPMV
jgi:hypothetical protein